MVRSPGSDPSEDQILRAKYLDWCSAKVAERFLRLTPEEIYELAHEASRDGDQPPRGVTSGSALPVDEPVDASLSFRAIVEQVTAVLTAELALPGFHEWATAYGSDASQYDDELLGLWREHLQ